MARRQLSSPLLLVVSLAVLQAPWTAGKMTRTCNLFTVTSGANPKGKCGRLLLGTLELVCNKVQNQAGWKFPVTVARRAAANADVTRSIEGGGREGKLRAALLTKQKAMSYQQRERRIWRRAADKAERAGKVRGFQGISCECCWNRCSLGEIMDHCGYL